MAVPLNSLSPVEIEFIAENELVNIVPNEHIITLHFISGSYGPFRPQRPTQVPLWLAVTLKKRAKCSIQPPPFLNPDGTGPFADMLKALLDHEKNGAAFCQLPFHYLEIAYVLLECASDDLRQPALLRSYLEDLREIRQVKARKGMENFITGTALKVNHLSMMELNNTRQFVLRALDELLDLQGTSDKDEDVVPAAGAAAGAATPAGPAVRQRS